MSVILLHTLKSIGKRPVQTVIIIFSVVLVTACLLLMIAFPSLFYQAYFLIADREYGEATYKLDYIPYSGTATEQELFETATQALGNDFVITLRLGETTAQVGSVNFLIDLTIADDLTALNSFNDIRFSQTSKSTVPSDCLPACVSSFFSEKSGIGIGDTFELLNIGKVFVVAVAEDSSIYFSHPHPRVAVQLHHSVLPPPYSMRIYGDHSPEEIEALKVQFDSTGMQLVAWQSTDDYASYFADSRVKSNMPPIYVAAVLIISAMVILLRLSCASIIHSRADELSRFKAAGATPAQCTIILMGEILLYSLAGGLVGLGAGKLLIDSLLQGFRLATSLTFNIEGWIYIVAFALAVFTAISAALSVSIRFASQSAKQLIVKNNKRVKVLPPIIPLIFAAATIAFGIAPMFSNGVEVYVFMVLFLCSACIFTATSVPHAIRFIRFVHGRVLGRGTSYIAIQNASESPSIGRTAVAVALLICFVFTGGILIDSVKLLSRSNFERFQSDYVVQNANVETESDALRFIEECKSLDGIEEVHLATRVSVPFISDHEDIDFRSLFAIGVCSAEDLKTFCKVDDETVRRFDETDYPIVVSYTIAREIGVEVGDKFTFEYNPYITPDGSPLTVVGIDTTVSNYDMFVYLPYDLATGLGDISSTFYLYGDADKNSLAEYFAHQNGILFYERENFVYDSTSFSMNGLLSAFGTIIYVAAAMGLVNLIAISSAERKREREIFRLAGFAPCDSARFCLSEVVTILLLGGIAGTVYALAVTSVLRPFSRVLGKFVAGYVSALSLVPIALAACALTLLCWMAFNLAPLVFSSLRRRKRKILPHDRRRATRQTR